MTVVILTCLKALLHGVINAIAVSREPLHQGEQRLHKEANQRNHSHDAEHAHDGGERFFIGKLLGTASQLRRRTTQSQERDKTRYNTDDNTDDNHND